MARTGKLKYEPVNFKLKEIIMENAHLFADLAKDKGVKLDSSIPENSTTYGDKEMINAVIRNLLSNAIKFTSHWKSVKIIVEDIESFWDIKVVDEGVGISYENQQKVFRVDAKFKTEGTSGEKGTGLGLLICKEFAEKNGGHIAVDSEVGKGSIFSFTVPKIS